VALSKSECGVTSQTQVADLPSTVGLERDALPERVARLHILLLVCTSTYKYGALNRIKEVVPKYDQKSEGLMGGTLQCRNPVILYRPSLRRRNKSYHGGVRYNP